MTPSNNSFIWHHPFVWTPVNDGDETPPSDSETPASTGQEENTQDSFTTEQVSEIVQKRLAKVKTEQKETLEQLKKLESIKGMTEEERDRLKQRVESLEKSVMTKEELAARDKQEASQKHQQELEAALNESKTWQQRYQTSTIQRAITDAAVQEEAFNPSQIVTLLQGQTDLVENTVNDTKTGEFVPRVKFFGRDKDGNPLEMDLTVQEAVAEMKKMEDVYGNLFKSGLTGGIGGNNQPGDGTLTDAVLGSQEEYEKNRDRVKAQV